MNAADNTRSSKDQNIAWTTHQWMEAIKAGDFEAANYHRKQLENMCR